MSTPKADKLLHAIDSYTAKCMTYYHRSMELGLGHKKTGEALKLLSEKRRDLGYAIAEAIGEKRVP